MNPLIRRRWFWLAHSVLYRRLGHTGHDRRLVSDLKNQLPKEKRPLVQNKNWISPTRTKSSYIYSVRSLVRIRTRMGLNGVRAWSGPARDGFKEGLAWTSAIIAMFICQVANVGCDEMLVLALAGLLGLTSEYLFFIFWICSNLE